MRARSFMRVFALVILATVLMTSVAYATDLLELANKGKEYVSQVVSVICLVGVLIAVCKLAVKRNFSGAAVTGAFGAALVYFLANPDKVTSIINTTLGKII